MAASQILKSLNKAFKETIKKHSYFSEWKKAGTRRYSLSSDRFFAGIELHLSKRWYDGGDFLIEVTVGHPIGTDIVNSRFTSLKDGFYCVSRELIFLEGGDGTIGNDGRWVSVNDESEIPAAMSDVVRIADRDAIPWFEDMKDMGAFTRWVADHAVPYALFPLTLELHGPDRVRDGVAKWMATLPRDVEDAFDWLERYSIFDRPFCDRLRCATWQSEERYAELVAELTRDILATNG